LYFILSQLLMEYADLEILLVEDNPFDAELTIRSLKKNQIANNVVHVNSGNKALDFLNARGEYAGRDANNKPKVILLDLKLGGVSGVNVLEQIKADDHTMDIPVVVLTGSKENADLRRCYDLGANSYLIKPIEFGSFTKGILIPLLDPKKNT
jgi:two-component system, response regulator